VWLYPAAWAVLAALGWAIGVGFRIERALTPGDLDHRVWRWVVDHRGGHPLATRFWHAATWLGNAEAAVPLAVAATAGMAALAWRSGDAAVFAAILVGARLLCVGLKAYFGRARPDELYRLVAEDTPSFPSGHALNASAFCVGLIALLAGRARAWPPWVRGGLLGALALAPGLIAASRVWLGVHYLSDVLAGLLLGTIWAASASAIHRGWVPRRRPGAGGTLG
jgi:undecaprenyl-diphosphatase